MKEQDKKEFGETMAGIGELMGKDISNSLMKIYWNALKPFPLSDVLTGLNKIATTSRFFPKPVEIIEAIQGNAESLAAEAMHHLVEAVGRVGAYQSVEFEDPGLQAVVEAWGGWPAVCGKTDEEWKYLKKDFLQLYELGKNRKHDRRHFAGLTEGTNRDQGYLDQIAPPILIGTESGRLQIGDGSKNLLQAPEMAHRRILDQSPYRGIPHEKKRLRLGDARHISGTLKSTICDLEGIE